MANPRIKLMMVGDSRIGKTSLLVTYIEGKFPAVSPMSVSRWIQAWVDGRQVTIGFWDDGEVVSVVSIPRNNNVIITSKRRHGVVLT